MDKIDVLGDRPERHDLFTKELLAETEDAELQNIVKKAAAELSSPIAFVSLVLDHIQFFKASVGLPPDLAAAKGMNRDVSFCQYVVRDEEVFEVTDAPNDSRIPQHVVKEYNIHSYLGVPIRVDDTVIGSFCVLDYKKRGFSKDERSNLEELAVLVNERLKEITKSRRQNRMDLTEIAFRPGLIELSETLRPIQHNIKSGYSAVAAISSFLGLAEYLFSKLTKVSEAFQFSLDAAKRANQSNEKLIYDVETAVADSVDCVNALERLTLDVGTSRLSDIVTAAQDLARNATKRVGGFPLPDFSFDPFIQTKGTWAIAIVTNCLLGIAAELVEAASNKGIRLRLIEGDASLELIFSSPDLSASAGKAAISKLIRLLENEPSVSVEPTGEKIRLTFKTIESDS